MSMNIYTPWGEEVVFANPDNGHLSDRKQCAELLIVGQKYTIERIRIHDSYTDIYLAGIKGKFNSVMFENVQDDKRLSELSTSH